MAGRSKGGARRHSWIALLRGVNLGSHNKVPMAGLRSLMSDIGAEDVRTYVQSGNVVFTSGLARDELARRIERELGARFGVDADVVLCTKAELSRIVARNPFADDESEPTRLHVTFLAEPPERGRAAELEREEFEPDRFHVTRAAVYLHTPDGYGRTKLSNAYFERKLGVRATTRNWRTVTILAELA
jgi:uncharacterized protein (DUF1697 family)